MRRDLQRNLAFLILPDMKFFIPFAEDEAEAEAIYADIRRFVIKMTHANLSEKRFGGLLIHEDYANAERQEIRVGMECFHNNELVIAILWDHKRQIYMVCTPSRGISQDRPIMFKKKMVLETYEFD